MPYVVDYDKDGQKVLVPGITFPSLPFPGRIYEKDLLPGDVLVWYSHVGNNDKTHSIIREMTAGAYSHASLYIGNGNSVDAGPEGISDATISSLLKQFEICNVLRWSDADQHRINVAIEYAKRCTGYSYASWDAKLLPFRRRARSNRLSINPYCFSFYHAIGLVSLLWRKLFNPKSLLIARGLS